MTDTQSWNRFSYVNNNPVNYNDPSGHVMEGACGFGNWDCKIDSGSGDTDPGGGDNDDGDEDNEGNDQPGDIDDDVAEGNGSDFWQGLQPVPEAPYEEPQSCGSVPFPCSDVDFYTETSYWVTPFGKTHYLGRAFEINPWYGEPGSGYSSFMGDKLEMVWNSTVLLGLRLDIGVFVVEEITTTFADTPSGIYEVSTQTKKSLNVISGVTGDISTQAHVRGDTADLGFQFAILIFSYDIFTPGGGEGALPFPRNP